jgi:hypothetical protein
MARTLRWSPPLGRLPGAEVVAAAGKPSVLRWSPPLASRSEQRWPPPLASRRCRGGRRHWRAVGASYLLDPTSVEVVHTCRVEMELGLRLKAGVILLLFVRYF